MSIGLIARDGSSTADVSHQVAVEIDALQRLLASRDNGRLLAVSRVAADPAGYAQLRTLIARRAPGELVAIVQSAGPDEAPHRSQNSHGHELLWAVLAGIGPGGSVLTSQSTEQRGLIAATDLAPTILEHLHEPLPTSMRGHAVHTDGPLHGAWLRELKQRLEAIYPRRLPALALMLVAWAALLGLARMARPRKRGAMRWALRVGALALLWTPVAVLLPAALEPSPGLEYALVVACAFAPAALADRMLPWPRAPIAPALTAVLALSVDALAGTQLLMRSLLGPDPAHGARFFGIGNELKSGLAVLVFAGVAAVLHPAARSRRAAFAMAGAGALLALVEGSALIGAGIGGTILVCAGTAVAATMVLPRAGVEALEAAAQIQTGRDRPPLVENFLRRARPAAGRSVAVVAAPVLGLVVLAALDLATAHGSGHFTGSVLDARSAADVREMVERRYSTAWSELTSGLMPVATVVTVLACALAIRARERVLAPVACNPAWRAALTGGLVAGVVGALVEDSGPVLLLVATFALACVVAYLWGKPTNRANL